MIVHINSGFDRRPNDKTNSWVTYFSQPLEVGIESKIGVKMCEIPYTCSQFKDSNNSFFVEEAYVNEDDETVRNVYIVMIDDSKFFENGDQVIEELNRISTASSYPFSFTINQNKITLFNTGTHKIRIVSNNDYETEIKDAKFFINGTETDTGGKLFNQMMYKLGFYQDYREKYLVPGTSQTAEGILKLVRTNCFYLTADIVDLDQLTPSKFKQPNIIAKVPLTGNFGSLQRYQVEVPLMQRCNDNSIDRIRFSVLDDDLEEVDLNNCPVTVTLEIR